MQKSAIFRKVKDNKGLRGDVPLYVPQSILKFDAEIVEKGHFWMDTRERINKFFGIALPSTNKIINISDLIKSHMEFIEKGSKLTLYNLDLIVDAIEKDNIIKVRIIKKKKFFQKLGEHIKKK